MRISVRSRGASFHRIGRHAWCPPRAGLGGSLLEGIYPCQSHEGGAWAPLGGVLRGTFPLGRYEARRAKPRSSSRGTFRSYRSQESWAAAAAYPL